MFFTFLSYSSSASSCRVKVGVAHVGDGRVCRRGIVAFAVPTNGGGVYAGGAGIARELGGSEVTTQGQLSV